MTRNAFVNMRRPADQLHEDRDTEYEQTRAGPYAKQLRPWSGTLRGSFAALLTGALLAGGLGAGVFGIQHALPRPDLTARIGIDAYRVLVRSQLAGSIVRFTGERPFHAVCRPLGHDGALIETSLGQRLLLTGGRVRQVSPSPHLDRRKMFAEAKLAGCLDTIATALASRLVSARPSLGLAGRFAGCPIRRIRLGRDRPAFYLLVSRPHLNPLGLELIGSGLSGVSTFTHAKPIYSTPLRATQC